MQGDLHDIGKNLVGIMLQGGRLRGDRPGQRRAAGAFVEAAAEEDAPVIGMSALLDHDDDR